MSNFEICLIVMACAVPFVALLFVLPKLKKKEVKKVEPVKTYAEIKQEEAKEEVKQEIKPEPTKQKSISAFTNSDFSPEDFRGYLNYKQKSLTKPSRVDLPADFKDRTEPYIPRRRRRQEKPKTVAEEIRSLSPELKALIFTGAFNKRDFN